MITTHVLDLALGRPAAGVPIILERATSEGWDVIGAGLTDGDGRLRTLIPAGAPVVYGRYRIRFDTAAYFAATAQVGFYPYVEVVFELGEPGHAHVPLLVSPFGYSTYRGS